MKNLSIVLFTLVLSLTFGYAQENTEENVVEDNSIKGQFETLIRKSGNYRAQGKRYEVVRVLELEALQNNVLDSIKNASSTITSLRATIEKNETEITSLNARLGETSSNLENITEEKDSIQFLGALMPKGTYKLIVWSIIFALIIFLAFFIYKFKNSNALTIQAKDALAELETEYEQHRRRALEREQKISRKLQDEINKNRK